MQIERILRLTVYALLLSAALWAGWWWRLGHEMLAIAGALAIPWVHVPALVLESLLIAVINRRDAAVPPATLGQRLHALWVEAALTPIVFYGRQPFRRCAVPDMPSPPGGRPRRGVLLVHGFYCNRGFWNPWMRRLRDQSVPFVAVDLEPPFGSIDDYVAPIEAAVQSLERSTGLPPVLVGHSMGGLALRAWLRASQGDARVHRVITIGTPHRGTWLTRLAFSSSNRRQMALGSEWLHALEQQEPVRRHAAFTCFWSHCDNVVFPASSATLQGADNRHVAGAAHVDLICRPEIFDETMRWVNMPGKGQ